MIAEDLISAQSKVDRARYLDLSEVTLTLNEVHALLHVVRPSGCDLISSHDPHVVGPRGEKVWCPGS